MKSRDLLGCAAAAALFLMVAAWIPLFGPFLSLLAPLPFIYYAVKLGMREGVKLAALTVGIIAAAGWLTGLRHVALFAVEFGLLGLVIAHLYQRKLGIGRTILMATGTMLLVAFSFLWIISLSRAQSPFQMLLSYLEAQLRATLQSYEQMGLGPEKAAEIEAFGQAFLDTLAKLYPALMVLGTGFVVWLNVMVSRPLLRARGLPVPEFMPLEQWKAPDSLVWGVIASGFALFLASGGLKWLAVNVLIVLMIVYVFHGLAILLFFLKKYRVPPWVRAGIYFLVVVQQLFLAVLALAGLFDQWVDFRKIYRRAAG